jgi:hypothetical protein
VQYYRIMGEKRVEFSSAPTAADARNQFVYVETDGGRPYIKSRYKARTPGGALGGFLRRDDVPGHLR